MPDVTSNFKVSQEGFTAMVKRMIFDAENRVKGQVKQNILKHIRPLYIMKPSEVFSLLGTGILFRVGKNYFLCSAAHVFDDFDSAKELCDGKCKMATFGQGATVILRESTVRTPKAADDPKRKKDLIDLGLMKLEPSNVEQIGRDRFLTLDQLDFQDAGSYMSLYCALGYPETRNKLKWRRPGDEITPSPLVYSLQKSPPEQFQKYQLAKKQNLLVHFQKKHSKSNEGLRIQAPDPHGMSGGGLWRYRRYNVLGTADDPAPDFKLVGVLIEWRKNPEGLLVTRTSQLRQFLVTNFLEVAGEFE
jgi:hypothetical protein